MAKIYVLKVKFKKIASDFYYLSVPEEKSTVSIVLKLALIIVIQAFSQMYTKMVFTMHLNMLGDGSYIEADSLEVQASIRNSALCIV